MTPGEGVAVVAALHRFPVKGLSPERMQAVDLAPGQYVPGDRLFAVENGPSGFDEAAPAHLPKSAFLMLMRHERLAQLQTAYDPASRVLTIRRNGALVCEGDLGARQGCAAVEAFLAAFCADVRRGPPRVRGAGAGFRFTDSPKGFVSLLNLASVMAVERVVKRPVDPLRFRANVAIEGLAPWVENTWVGRTLTIGAARLTVTALTDRCAATEVDPSTGARDMPVVKTLVGGFGHNVCGVYASVAEGGLVREGDPVTAL